MERKSSVSTWSPVLGDPKILLRIFDLVTVEDLKACRLVCRAWHAPSTSTLGSKIHPILLHDRIEWKKFLKLWQKSFTSQKLKLHSVHPFHGFAFFSHYPEDPTSTPYKTAMLDYVHSKYSRFPRPSIWDQKFFCTYGVHIRELKFIQFPLYSERGLRDFREQLSTSCPNLAILTIQLQKETGSTSSSSSSSTPTPSPSPQMLSGSESIFFFPPTESSQRKNLPNLKCFTFATDNRIHLNPHALEEFMALMPSLEEFTYRFTGIKKQWTLVRRIDIIDILYNILNAGHYQNLKKLDFDSTSTVLSGDDFRKLSRLKLRSDLKLTKFSCQVFIKSEQDWEYLCSFLIKISTYVRDLDIQVRTNFPQLLTEEELPAIFEEVRSAKLLLDSNLKTFLRRMPNIKYFTGVYDNELFTFSEEEVETKLKIEEEGEELEGAVGGAGVGRKTSEELEGPSCPTAEYLKIQGNEEFGLDVEWKSRVFCNITSFETDIFFDQDLRQIWAHLPNSRVRRLILHLKTAIPEQAFTGGGAPTLTHQSIKAQRHKDLHDDESLEQINEYPNMGLMKKLHVFEIHTGNRQDAYGTHFSASLIIYGVALLPRLRRLVLPPGIPPKCLEDSVRYLSKLKDLNYLSVCDDTFKNVLPFHSLKMDLPNLEIVVKYYQPEIKRLAGNFWRLERFKFPDFLPEHGRKVTEKRHSAP